MREPATAECDLLVKQGAEQSKGTQDAIYTHIQRQCVSNNTTPVVMLMLMTIFQNVF